MSKRITAILELAFIFILIMLLSPDTIAQDVLTLKDGLILTGKIEKEEGGKINFITEGGVQLELYASDIIKIEGSTGGIIQRKYNITDPNHTRLFFAPTGRSLESGDGYFADYYVFFPTLAYAATNRLTLYGSMSIIPGVGLDEQVFFFAPKLGIIQSEDVALATGIMIIKTPEEDFIPGIVYGVGTAGYKDRSFTFGTGLGYAWNGENLETFGPVIMAGGDMRISGSIKLLTENWWLPSEEDTIKHPVFSIGIRFFGEHLAADLGFIHVVGTDLEGIPLIPWVDFVYNF